MSIEQLDELETQLLFSSEDHHCADLVAYVIELKNEVQALENQIEDTETLDIEGDPLRDALYKALPFVEDAEYSQDFKPGVVAKIVKEIRQALGE